MSYTKVFEPLYEDGWEDLPIEETPITAEAFNDYDEAITHIEDYLESDDSQSNLADAYDETATYEAGDYRIHNGDLYKCLVDIDTPEEWDSTKWESCLITDEMATSGGSTVTITPTLSTGTKIADYSIDGTSGELYAPTGGGGNANIWTGTQAELEEVFDELEEGTVINITDDEQEVIEGGTIYSEDEQCIGLWTDSKPIYQKTLTLASGTISSGVLAVGTITGVDEIIKSECSCTQTNNSRHYGLPLIRTTASESIYASTYVDSGTAYAQIFSGTGYALEDIEFTVYYTKTSDSPIDVTIGKNTMYIASSDCYSTVEKEIGCWTDGKPLYQKTVHIPTLPSTTYSTVTFAHNIENIDKIVEWKGYGRFESGSVTEIPAMQFSNSGATTLASFYGQVDTTNISIMVGTDRSAMSADFTIKYTKTTDTAGSGQYTPASGKAVHYSTDEQVIGTWTDGSTIYERTYNYTTAISVPAGGAWTDTGTNISFVSKMIDATARNNNFVWGVISVFKDSNNLKLTTGGNLGSNTLTVNSVTIRYTKS